MKRRQILKLSAATTALAFPAIARPQDRRFAGTTLRINGYGGDWDRLMQEHIATPLERKTGLKATFTPGTGAAALAKVLAAPDDPAFDILMLDSPGMPEVVRAQVAKTVTVKDVKGLTKALPGMREFGDYGVPVAVSALILAYNTNRVKTPPRSYADLARPDLKDRVALFNLDHNGGLLQLIAMAEANGGNLDNMSPGFAALAKLKPNVVTIASSTVNMLQLLEQEEVWAAAFFDGRVYSLQNAGKPIAMVEPAEGTYSQITYLNPVKNSKHPEAVQAFLDEMLSGEYLSQLASFFGYRPAAEVRLPANIAGKIYKPKNPKPVDWAKIAAVRGALLTRFNKEFR